jgi:hypothetical protein
MAIEGFDQYSADQKKKTLEAMALAGSQGKAAFDTARSRVEGYNKSVIDAALARSQAIGGSGGPGSSADIIAQGQANRLGDLASMQANFDQDLTRRQSAYSAYHDQVAAAAPAIEAQTREKLATREAALKQIQAQLDADAREREEEKAFQRETWQHEREKWAADLADTRAKAAAKGTGSAGTVSDSELKTILTGAGERTSEAAKGRKAGYETALPAKGQRPMAGDVRMMENVNMAAPDAAKSPQQWSREIGLNTPGLDPNRVVGLIPPSRDKVAPTPPNIKNIMTFGKTDEKTAKTILASPRYTDARNLAYTFLNATVDPASGTITEAGDYTGMTPWQAYSTYLAASLLPNEGQRYTRTFDALLGEFAPEFQKRY